MQEKFGEKKVYSPRKILAGLEFFSFWVVVFLGFKFKLCDLFTRLWKRYVSAESHKAVIGQDFLKQNKLGPLLSINHFEPSVHPRTQL